MEATVKKTQNKGSDNPFLAPSKPKRGKGKLIFILVLLILIAALVAAMVFNLFGLKDKLVHMLITSPVAFIWVVSVRLAVMNLSKGSLGIFTTQ